MTHHLKASTFESLEQCNLHRDIPEEEPPIPPMPSTTSFASTADDPVQIRRKRISSTYRLPPLSIPVKNPHGEWRRRLFKHGMFKKRNGWHSKGKGAKLRPFFRSESLPNLDDLEKEDLNLKSDKEQKNDFNNPADTKYIPRGTSLDGAFVFNGYHPDPPLAVFGDENSFISTGAPKSDNTLSVRDTLRSTASTGEPFDDGHSSVQNSIGDCDEYEREMSLGASAGSHEHLTFNIQDLAALDDAEIVNQVMSAVKQFRRRSQKSVSAMNIDVLSESNRCTVEDARLMNLAVVPSTKSGNRESTSSSETRQKDSTLGGKLGVQGLVKMVAERQMAHGAILKSSLTRRPNHSGDSSHKHSSPLKNSLRRTRSTHDTTLEEVEEKRPRLRRLISLHTLTKPHTNDAEDVDESEEPKKPLVKNPEHSKSRKKHFSKDSTPFHMFRRRHSLEFGRTALESSAETFRNRKGIEEEKRSFFKDHEAYEFHSSSETASFTMKRKRSVLVKEQDRTEIKAVPHYGLSSDSSETTVSSHQEFKSDYDDFHIRKMEKPQSPKRKPPARVGFGTVLMSRIRRSFKRW